MNLHLPIASLLVGVFVSPAVAGKISFTEAKVADVPQKLAPRGKKIERVVKFTDKNGANYVVFSSTTSEKQAPDDDQAVRTTQLFLDHWAVAGGDEPRSLLPARDAIDCYMGAMLATFVPKAFTVTDIDGDGLAEITYGYQLACRSDVSAASYKLLMVEDGKKHILRGFTKIAHDNPPEGGTYKADPDATKWEKGFLEHAVDVWKATVADLDDPTKG
ncbi:MAG TPA: hypothetical protein VGM39_24635 [Kofleriaceae bacterium]